MSFSSKNYGSKPSLVKPILIAVAILLIIGGAYSFFNKKSETTKVENENNNESLSLEEQMKKINPTGLDLDEKIKTVGDVEKVIAKWVEVNPQAILNAFSNMEKKLREDQEKNAQKNIGTKKDEIFSSSSPNYSPEGYDVTVVEFFDYTCGYCKHAQGVIDGLVKEDKKVRIIFKEFPIMGPSSEELSVVALAVNMVDPSSYKKFHNALMKSNTVRSKDAALKLAKELGIDSSKVEQTIKNDKSKIDAMIEENRKLGQTIGIRGTPGFIIGEELIPGFIDLEAMKAKIAAIRKK